MSQAFSELDPVEDLVEEFVERYRRGERPAVTEYADKHPELAERIRTIFPALLVMEELGSGGGPPTGLQASHTGSGGCDAPAPGRFPLASFGWLRRHGDRLRGDPGIVGAARGFEDTSFPSHCGRDPLGKVSSRGPGRGRASPCAYRPGVRDRRARRRSLLHDAVYPWAWAGRRAARGEADEERAEPRSAGQRWPSTTLASGLRDGASGQRRERNRISGRCPGTDPRAS